MKILPLSLVKSSHNLLGLLRTGFSDQFREKYNSLQMHWLQLSDAIVYMLNFNPIIVNNYASFFNCTPLGQALDTMMVLT